MIIHPYAFSADVVRVLGARVARPCAARTSRGDSKDHPTPDARPPAWFPDAIVHLARVATIPYVVDHAARLPPPARLRQIAFVGGLASRRVGADRTGDLKFAELAYRAATDTAHRIASDLSLSRVWEDWEGRYLLRACATLAGRLRAAIAGASSMKPSASAAAPVPSRATPLRAAESPAPTR